MDVCFVFWNGPDYSLINSITPVTAIFISHLPPIVFHSISTCNRTFANHHYIITTYQTTHVNVSFHSNMSTKQDIGILMTQLHLSFDSD